MSKKISNIREKPDGQKRKRKKSYNATSNFSVTEMVLVVCGTCAIYEPLWPGGSRDHRKGAEGVSFNSYLFPRS